jgi:hypothetical protein
MSLILATLCLNEMEWLPRLYEQHKDWPELVKWVFVESADIAYAHTNPDMVSQLNLSVDGTSEYLKDLASKDTRVVYIPFGLSGHPSDPSQGKCQARQQYLNIVNIEKPDVLFVLDADEFYTYDAQQSINNIIKRKLHTTDGFCFKFRHIWRPPSVASKPLMQLEVTGGFWNMHHCRGFRCEPGMKYENNHNLPTNCVRIKRYDNDRSNPQCIHMGYASSHKIRSAKARYYIARGEGITDHRQEYVICRAAFEVWRPGMPMPKDTKIVPYNGPIPEVFA